MICKHYTILKQELSTCVFKGKYFLLPCQFFSLFLLLDYILYVSLVMEIYKEFWYNIVAHQT